MTDFDRDNDLRPGYSDTPSRSASALIIGALALVFIIGVAAYSGHNAGPQHPGNPGSVHETNQPLLPITPREPQKP